MKYKVRIDKDFDDYQLIIGPAQTASRLFNNQIRQITLLTQADEPDLIQLKLQTSILTTYLDVFMEEWKIAKRKLDDLNKLDGVYEYLVEFTLSPFQRIY